MNYDEMIAELISAKNSDAITIDQKIMILGILLISDNLLDIYNAITEV